MKFEATATATAASLLALAGASVVSAASALSPRCEWSDVARRDGDGIDHSLAKRCVTPFNRTAFNQYFAFGDSYTDVGYKVSAGVAASEPGAPNAGGPNWIGFMSDTYAPVTTKRRSLGQPGSFIDRTFGPLQTGGIMGGGDDFTTQTSSWKTGFSPAPSGYPYTIAQSLFFCWFGQLDLAKKADGTAYGAKSTSQILLDTYFAQLDILRTAGAPAFVLLNALPIQRFPVSASNSAALNLAIGSDVADFNVQLSKRAWAYSQKWSIPVLVYDAATLYSNVLNAPTSFGFIDNVTYASGNNSLMWGSASSTSTSALHKLMAIDLNNFLILNSV